MTRILYGGSYSFNTDLPNLIEKGAISSAVDISQVSSTNAVDVADHQTASASRLMIGPKWCPVSKLTLR